MHIKKTLSFSLSLAILILLLSGPLMAIPGDCNGDGYINASDIASIAKYLLQVAPITGNPQDCDCDGHQGITIGDALQIRAAIFAGAELYPAWGDDYIQPCGVEFYFNEKIKFDAFHTVDTIEFYIRLPNDFNVCGLVLPFSFEAEENQMDVECVGTELPQGVPQGWSITSDNDDHKILLIGELGLPDCIEPGVPGLLFKAYFIKLSNGNPNDVRMSSYKRFRPLVIGKTAYDGENGQRLFMPASIRTRYGDTNCDGRINLTDAVYMINYIFLEGAQPGDCEY